MLHARIYYIYVYYIDFSVRADNGNCTVEKRGLSKYYRGIRRLISNKHLLCSLDILSPKSTDMLKLFFQKMYKDEAEKMLCNYSAVPDTPEMERIRSTQKNISSVSNSAFLFACNFWWFFFFFFNFK